MPDSPLGAERGGAVPPRAASRLRHLGKALLVLWLPAIVVPGALLMAAHVLTLPAPAAGDVGRALGSSRSESERGRLLAVHVLYGACPCSRRVVDHLVARGARRDVAERVLLVDGAPAIGAQLAGAGFLVEWLSADELHRRYHIESVPLLVVAGRDDTVLYMGGYTSAKQGPDIRDVAIIDEALAGGAAASLPLFGCAVSRELQRKIDPLGLKY
jgi:hypothetical protein